MRIPLCLLLLFLLASSAHAKTEEWQQLKTQSEQLRNSDPIYALFKLQRAWELLARKSPATASKELRNDLAITYGKLNPSSEASCLKLTDKQLQTHMKKSRNLIAFQAWQISKKSDALYLTSPETSSCLSGRAIAEEAAGKDPQKKKEVDEFYERQNAEFKERAALLPVVISAQNKKYQDLIALSGSLKDGQTKAVTFDINAFVPEQFRRINWP